jgi:hypothetical protein
MVIGVILNGYLGFRALIVLDFLLALMVVWQGMDFGFGSFSWLICIGDVDFGGFCWLWTIGFEF